MDAETAHQQLDIRCYRWALEDLQREIDQGYPLLRTVMERRVHSWIALLEGLDNEQKLILSRVLVKRRFRAPTSMGDPFNAEDAAILKQYERVLPMLPPKTLDASKGDIKPVKARRLASRIIERLNPILGDQLEDSGEMTWKYVTPIGDWNVITEFSVYNPREPEIHHQHHYSRRDYIRTRGTLLPRYQFATCLGVGINQWRVDYGYELEPAADSIAEVTAHFIDAFPTLAQGLSPND